MFEMVPFRRNSGLRRKDHNWGSIIDNFFADDFMTPMNFMTGSFKVDLKETEDSYLVKADLPGIQKEAIDIDYNNNYLTISAKRDDSVEDKKENQTYHFN